jgi:hypothetical protein
MRHWQPRELSCPARALLLLRAAALPYTAAAPLPRQAGAAGLL